VCRTFNPRKSRPAAGSNKPKTEKEAYHELVDYCKGMEMELIAWKAKMFDLTRKSKALDLKKEKSFAQHSRPEHSHR